MRNNCCLLPRLKRKGSLIKRSRQTVFEGLSSYTSALSREIIQMEGLSARAYPAIGTAERYFSYDVSAAEGDPHGIYVHDSLVMAKGEYLYTVSRTGECAMLCKVSNTDKLFASYGSYLFVMPDKICIDTGSGAVRNLSLESGVLTGAHMGTSYLTHSNTDFYQLGFRVGDGVDIRVKDYILGSTTVFSRKITDIAGGTLYFDTAFERAADFDISVSLSFPELTQMCVSGTRLIGCKEGKIFLSEAGNPFNFCSGTGEDADPVCLETGGIGKMTACIPWHETVVFFKEDRLFRLMGHGARDFLLTDMKVPGITEDCAKSLCDVNGRLYYLSSGGVYRFDGQYPVLISDVLPQGLSHGVGGTDGVCYYVVAADREDFQRMYVFHDEREQWFVQHIIYVVSMATWGDLLFLQTEDGLLLRNPRRDEILNLENTAITEIASVTPSTVTFGEESGDFSDGLRLCEVSMRAKGDGEMLSVEISYDGGSWETVSTHFGSADGWLRFPVFPHRANAYRLRVIMKGSWCISEICCSYEMGKQ